MKRIARSLLHGFTLLVALSASGCLSFSHRDATPSNSQNQTAGNMATLPVADSAKLCMATAEVMEQAGKFKEAFELYERARELDNRLGPQATRRLAVLLDRSGNFDRALDEYRRGIQENPRDAELFNNLGYGYYCRGQLGPAEEQLRKALSLDPKSASAWTNLGLCLAMQMRYDESLVAFEKAVSKAQARCNLGYIQATQSRIVEARQSYEAALRVEPGLQIARIALQKLGQPNPQHAAGLPTTETQRAQSEETN